MVTARTRIQILYLIIYCNLSRSVLKLNFHLFRYVVDLFPNTAETNPQQIILNNPQQMHAKSNKWSLTLCGGNVRSSGAGHNSGKLASPSFTGRFCKQLNILDRFSWNLECVFILFRFVAIPAFLHYQRAKCYIGLTNLVGITLNLLHFSGIENENNETNSFES